MNAVYVLRRTSVLKPSRKLQADEIPDVQTYFLAHSYSSGEWLRVESALEATVFDSLEVAAINAYVQLADVFDLSTLNKVVVQDMDIANYTDEVL